MDENQTKIKLSQVRCLEGEDSINREKALLWPILCALGVERKKWEKFRYFPDQLVGLAIACVKERDRQIHSLRRKNRDLVKTLDGFRQLPLNLKICPFGTGEKE